MLHQPLINLDRHRENLNRVLALPWVQGSVKQWQQLKQEVEAQIGPLPSPEDWARLKLSLLLLALPWSGGALAYQWLTAVPNVPNCHVPQWSQADLDRLDCIQQKMKSGQSRQVLAGIRQLKAWPEDSPMYGVSQRLLEDWSLVAWSQAQLEFESGEWETSAQLVAEIPAQLPLWTQVQDRLGLWREIRTQGENLYDLAQSAIRAQDWTQALDHAKALAKLDNDYWKRQGLHELPLLIEERQAAVGDSTRQPLAQFFSDPRSGADSRSHPEIPRSRLPMPMMIGLERPAIAKPHLAQPEFSTV